MKKYFAIFGLGIISASPLAALQYGRNVQQMMALQATADAVSGNTAAEAAPLPVRILDIQLEREIRAGNHATTMADLEKCRLVLLNGSFAWGRPTVEMTPASTCVAEVHMRKAPDGQGPSPTGGDTLLAIAYVPAGGSVKCNISEFPESGYQAAAGTVMFPADNEPELKDVVAAMDKEQKQNAGMKTAASAVAGGLLTFFLATNQGDTMGKRIATSGAVAAGAGGLTFASTQAGKVAGDTIMSAGMNAGAGALIGNMGAGMYGGGDSILLVKDCVGEETKGQKCLWGYVTAGGRFVLGPDSDNTFESCYYNRSGGGVICKKKKLETDTKEPQFETALGFYNITMQGSNKLVKEMTDTDWEPILKGQIKCFIKDSDSGIYKENDNNCSPEDRYFQITTAKAGGTRRLAMIENFNMSEGLTGISMRKFNEWKAQNPNPAIVGRNADGGRNREKEEAELKLNSGEKSAFILANFTPMTIDASDGDVIDFDNKARLKGTAIGAGTGAALGGFAAYQGAKNEIDERLVVELQNYEGSLRDFYCITGARYLGKYNEQIMIPALK